MDRGRIQIALSTFHLVLVVSIAHGQQLTGTGILATGVVSRSRLAVEDFQLGDLMYVRVGQPASSGNMYVSAHMEYLDDQQQWQPVLTAKTALGEAYRSGRYLGIRDFVRFEGCSVNTTRHVCLFLPYEAAALPTNKVYQRRYVLRVWDHRNEPVARTVLAPEAVSARRDDHGKLLIVAVRVKTCSSLLQPSGDQLEPLPESQDDGTLQLFNAVTGVFLCGGGATQQ